MDKKYTLWCKLIALILALVVLLPILVACGGGEEEAAPTTTATSTPTATPAMTPTGTPIVTPTPTTTAGPVKLGAINPWSGPEAMSGLAFADPCIKLVEQQVKDQGGILGGRDVKVIKYDNRSSVAEGQAGVKKLVEGDKVSALLFGGTNSAQQMAVADAAEQYKILFCANTLPPPPAYNGKFGISSGPARYEIAKVILYSAINVEKAKTVAFLSSDLEDSRSRIADMKPGLSAAGVKVVYEDQAPVNTMDYSPYLTKIKYEKPDYLYLDFAFSEGYITVAKQIMELGGWGDMKVGGLPSAESATKQPGGDGWYLALFWFPGSTYPGSVKFETGLKAILGRTPSASHVYFYMGIWTAIHAIELAGTDTDRVAIAQAARSGKLAWETPAGLAHWNRPDHFSDLGYQLARAEGGKLVPVPVTE